MPSSLAADEARMNSDGKVVGTYNRSFRQMCAEEAEPVAVKDVGDVRIAVAAGGENGREFLNVGDGIDFERRLFGAEAAVEIRAHGGVVGISRELTNVVDVVGNVRERDALARRL